MSTSVLKALPGKLDIKRHLRSILFVPCIISSQSKEEGKHQESIQSSTTPDPRYHMVK